MLSFENADAAELAFKRISADSALKWMGRNVYVRPSVYPSDPLLLESANGIPVGYWQWAVPVLNLTSAWDKIRGHAYVGIVDTGIQTVPSVHPDLQRNFRAQFSSAAQAGYAGNYNDIYLVDDQMGQSGYRGHGTHVAGIIGAMATIPGSNVQPPNATNQGVAGVCWHCSLMIAKASAITSSEGGYTYSGLVESINWAVKSGAQVLNLSFEFRLLSDTRDTCNIYPVQDNDPMCQALAFAASRDVIIAAAAGNEATSDVALPARDVRAIPVGATQSNGNLWVDYGIFQGNYGPTLQTRGVIAPGKDVLSTVYTNGLWNSDFRCGDVYPNELGFPAVGAGYGSCTGTSMAAPHIAGIVALMRSLNPLLSASFIRDRLLESSSSHYAPNWNIGHGVPNASFAVDKALTTTNRLTPLFAFFNATSDDYFYTTVPQMGSAAIAGTLPVMWPGQSYVPVGNLVMVPDPTMPNSSNLFQYYFPGGYTSGRAQAWLFSSHKNPFTPSVDLIPLYRLSYACTSYSAGVLHFACSNNNAYHVDHTYSTDWNEVQSLVASSGYRYDGIEGYVYPITSAVQPGMEVLVRAYHAVKDDHAIFPASAQTAMTTLGYTSNVTNLGYVYPNFGTGRPTY